QPLHDLGARAPAAATLGRRPDGRLTCRLLARSCGFRMSAQRSLSEAKRTCRRHRGIDVHHPMPSWATLRWRPFTCCRPAYTVWAPVIDTRTVLHFILGRRTTRSEGD